MITTLRIPIVQNACNGIYLRWWFNGWHYYYFTNSFEVTMKTQAVDIQTTKVFSVISRVERATKTKTEYTYTIKLEGIEARNIDGFANLLIAEKVEQYEGSTWYEVDITRKENILKEENSPAYSVEFEVTRKELPNTPAVFQRTQFFYIGDTLADLDVDEVIALNKQVNNIAELQDRQADFTAQFKVRKTRAMRALFELSGEVGANTSYPYTEKTCRLVQDGIEIISDGRMQLNKSDNQYYYVAVYSGNKSVFNGIGKLKLTDLDLPSCAHTWNALTQATSHASDLDYLYPLVEPSDDGGLIPLYQDGEEATLSGAFVWPFIKIKAIWDEIFSDAGYTAEGPILTNTKFLSLFMPIANRKAGDVSRYLYSLYNNTQHTYGGSKNLFDFNGNVVINGSSDFFWQAYGWYTPRFTGNYKFRIYLIQKYGGTHVETVHTYVRVGETDTELTLKESEYIGGFKRTNVFEGELEAVSGVTLTFIVSKCLLYYYDIAVTAIESPTIGYSSAVQPAMNLPEITQADFVKAICNMFALVPETNARERKVFFWSYDMLYQNIPQARNWSAFLSEKGEETSFKFGEYAQLNYMKYKESEDVIPENGTGAMQINDTTLPESKDMLNLPFSYSDEVLVYFTPINVSRIAMNIYDDKQDTYNAADKIDARIVHVSEATGKVFNIQEVSGLEIPYTVNDPKKASSIEVSFGSLATNYASLANMLYRPKLLKAKFNLPAYEVAGLKHYVPIYLEQYKAYFYVNKINNYVVGKLCAIDLIQL